MINITEMQKKLFYFLGLFCTFIALKFGGGVALFNYIILLIIVVQFGTKRQICFYPYKFPMFLFILLMPISIGLNFTNISSTVMSDGLGITIKFVSFILPIIILFSDQELCLYRKSFFKGLYIGSWIQLIWGTMQIVLYHINGLLLNQFIFGDLLHITLEGTTWTRYTGIGIRPTGIGWETAVYAISLLFGFAYTEKLYCKLLFGIAILASTSSTGIMTLVVLIIYQITLDKYLFEKNRIREGSYKKKNPLVKMLVITFIAVLIIIIAIIYNKNGTSDLISYFDISINRVTEIILGKNSDETSTSIHMLYYQKLIATLFNGNIIQSFFGYGNFMVGRIYSSLYGLYTNITSAWNPESDFVTIVLGTGILGASLYYFLICKAFMLCKNRKLKRYLVIILISGFSYLFIRGTYTFLIIAFLMVKENDTNLVSKD
jgi:hypothetical protein